MNGFKENDVGQNNIWHDANIPPLEYCTIERAAKILSCEVEDFWHWRSRYHIDFYKFVDVADLIMFDSSIKLKDKVEELSSLLLEYSEDIIMAFPFLMNIVPPGMDAGDTALFSILKPIKVDPYDQAPDFVKVSDAEISVPQSAGHGLFRIFGGLRKGKHSRTAGEEYVRLVGVHDCSLYRFKARSEQLRLSEIDDKQIYVVKKDIEYLYESKLTGSFDGAGQLVRRSLEKKETLESMSLIDKRGHHHSISREGHIMALIYSFLNYKDEIFKNGKYGKTRHVAATLNHWDYISPGVKEPSDRHLLKILRDFGKLPHDRHIAKVRAKKEH